MKRTVKAKVTKVNRDLGYAFLMTNTKKHEVFVTKDSLGYGNCICGLEIGQTVKVLYKETERGFLATIVNQ